MCSERMISGRKCVICENGGGGALLIQPVDEYEARLLSNEVRLIGELSHAPFTLAAFVVGEWNRELSPWDAPPVFGDEAFGCGAADTLEFITKALLPELRKEYGGARCFLGGYSLAGLFALWAAYQTDVWGGIAAVSPSVWFPGWESYMSSNVILSPRIYLSLGDKEEKTRNKTMAAVGDNLRRQYELLKSTDTVSGCVLEWNSGNHFSQPELRTAKGFAWLLQSADQV